MTALITPGKGAEVAERSPMPHTEHGNTMRLETFAKAAFTAQLLIAVAIVVGWIAGHLAR